MSKTNIFFTLYFDGNNVYHFKDTYNDRDDLWKYWRNDMIECGAKWAHIFDSDGILVGSFI